MNFTKLLFGDKYIFTDNAVEKMKKVKMGRSMVKRIVNEYDRKEDLKAGLRFYTKKFDRVERGALARKDAPDGKTYIISVWERQIYKK